MNTQKQQYATVLEMVRYLFWGVMTTAVSWLSYAVFAWLGSLVFFGQETLTVFVANCLSWVLAVLFAFVTNKRWVFHSRSWKREIVLPELGKFVAARVATGIIEIIAVPVLVWVGLNQTVFGIQGMVAKAVVSVVVVLLNYVFSKRFIFK